MTFARTIIATTLITVMSGTHVWAEGDAKKGERVFKRCGTCHMVGPKAKRRIGPPLNDLFGRKAGSLKGFKYSKVMVALGEAGLVWNPEDFAAYVKDPRGWLPKKAKEMGLDCGKLARCRNRMAFAGLRKPKEVEDVIAFLLTHDADGVAKSE